MSNPPSAGRLSQLNTGDNRRKRRSITPQATTSTLHIKETLPFTPSASGSKKLKPTQVNAVTEFNLKQHSATVYQSSPHLHALLTTPINDPNIIATVGDNQQLVPGHIPAMPSSSMQLHDVNIIGFVGRRTKTTTNNCISIEHGGLVDAAGGLKRLETASETLTYVRETLEMIVQDATISSEKLVDPVERTNHGLTDEGWSDPGTANPTVDTSMFIGDRMIGISAINAETSATISRSSCRRRKSYTPRRLIPVNGDKNDDDSMGSANRIAIDDAFYSSEPSSGNSTSYSGFSNGNRLSVPFISVDTRLLTEDRLVNSNPCHQICCHDDSVVCDANVSFRNRVFCAESSDQPKDVINCSGLEAGSFSLGHQTPIVIEGFAPNLNGYHSNVGLNCIVTYDRNKQTGSNCHCYMDTGINENAAVDPCLIGEAMRTNDASTPDRTVVEAKSVEDVTEKTRTYNTEVDPAKYRRIREYHSGDIKYACSLCGNMYKWRKSLNKHWKEKHLTQKPPPLTDPVPIRTRPIKNRTSPPSRQAKVSTATSSTHRTIVESEALNNQSDISRNMMAAMHGWQPIPDEHSNRLHDVLAQYRKSQSLSAELTGHHCFHQQYHSPAQYTLPGISPPSMPSTQLDDPANDVDNWDGDIQPLDLSIKSRRRNEAKYDPEAMQGTGAEIMHVDDPDHQFKQESTNITRQSSSPASTTDEDRRQLKSRTSQCSSKNNTNSHKVYNCSVCNNHYLLVEEANDHFHSSHMEELEKEISGRSPPRNTNVAQQNEEWQLSDPKNPLKCIQCDFIGRWPTELQKHAASHSDLRPFKCLICSLTYKWRWDLAKHFDRTHPNFINPYKKKDRECTERTDTEGRTSPMSLQANSSDKAGSLPSSVDASVSSPRKRRHIADGARDDQSAVDTCSPMSSKKPKKTVNVDFNSGILDLSSGHQMPKASQRMALPRCQGNVGSCTNSRVRAGSAADVTGHNSFKCKWCDYKGRWKSELSQHERCYHGRGRPHHCTLCSYASNWKWDVQKHVRKQHLANTKADQAEEVTDVSQYIVDIPDDILFGSCDDDKLDLSIYDVPVRAKIQTLMTRARTLEKCQRCPYLICGPTDLKQHLIVHSAEQPYRCRSCDFRSKWRCKVKKHMKIRKHKGHVLVGKRAMKKILNDIQKPMANGHKNNDAETNGRSCRYEDNSEISDVAPTDQLAHNRPQ